MLDQEKYRNREHFKLKIDLDTQSIIDANHILVANETRNSNSWWPESIPETLYLIIKRTTINEGKPLKLLVVKKDDLSLRNDITLTNLQNNLTNNTEEELDSFICSNFAFDDLALWGMLTK